MSAATNDSPAGNGATILLAKTALDGHWRGIKLVEDALREAGFTVIMIGMAEPEEIVRAAVEEQAHAVGLNVGGRPDVVHRIADRLQEAAPGVPMMAGGVLPPWACKELEARGIACFPPGSRLPDIVAAAARLCRINTPPS